MYLNLEWLYVQIPADSLGDYTSGFLSAKITDASVDVYRVRRNFTCEALLLVEEVTKANLANPQWTCPICKKGC